MRILVLQLARFGDIYQTWPTVRALVRQNPTAEVHVLVRSRFQDGLDGLPSIIVHALPTAEILKPILEDGLEEVAHENLCSFLAPLRALSFDKVINLSFSPTSSYLTDIFTTDITEVCGYSRDQAGFLKIADDSSAYFYAQVGIGRFNRYHITEIFAAVAGVELQSDDYYVTPPRAQVDRRGVVVHLGASTSDKSYSPELWVQVLSTLVANSTEKFTLVGSASEKAMADTVVAQVGSVNIENLVGSTTLTDLFARISQARLLIGADSAPIHIAALTDTPVLNLSCARVNFWETGPRSAGSRILVRPDLNQLSAETVTLEVTAMLNHEGPRSPCWLRDVVNDTYTPYNIEDDPFTWQLTEALYTGTPYPPAESTVDRLAFQRLYEIAELALHQLDRWSDIQTQPTVARILHQIDDLLNEIPKLNRRVDPVVQWFQTQRIRIPQGSDIETLQRTRDAFQDLLWVTKVYREFGDYTEEIRKAIVLCRECAPELREFDPGRIQGSFQTLLLTLQELARHSTKVGEHSWSSVLNAIGEKLESRDFIALADLIQWKLVPAFQSELARNEKETLSPDVIS